MPDPSAVVTGYTVTTYTPSGTTVKSLPATTVRWADLRRPPAGTSSPRRPPAARSPRLPVWYSKADDGRHRAVPGPALQKLKATFTSSGSLIVSWTNPAANKGHADGVFISLNGETVAQHLGTVPDAPDASPPSHVPPGDLTVDVFVQSSNDGTFAVTHIMRNAHVAVLRHRQPGSGRRAIASRCSSRRSWGKRACGSAHCSGAAAQARLRQKTYSDYLDEHGQAVFTVSARPACPTSW